MTVRYFNTRRHPIPTLDDVCDISEFEEAEIGNYFKESNKYRSMNMFSRASLRIAPHFSNERSLNSQNQKEIADNNNNFKNNPKLIKANAKSRGKYDTKSITSPQNSKKFIASTKRINSINPTKINTEIVKYKKLPDKLNIQSDSKKSAQNMIQKENELTAPRPIQQAEKRINTNMMASASLNTQINLKNINCQHDHDFRINAEESSSANIKIDPKEKFNDKQSISKNMPSHYNMEITVESRSNQDMKNDKIKKDHTIRSEKEFEQRELNIVSDSNQSIDEFPKIDVGIEEEEEEEFLENLNEYLNEEEKQVINEDCVEIGLEDDIVKEIDIPSEESLNSLEANEISEIPYHADNSDKEILNIEQQEKNNDQTINDDNIG